MSYKLALHVLATFTGQVVPIHKHITFFLTISISGTKIVTMKLTEKAAVNNVPSQVRNCAVPLDHLGSEISFSRTRKIQNFKVKND